MLQSVASAVDTKEDEKQDGEAPKRGATITEEW